MENDLSNEPRRVPNFLIPRLHCIFAIFPTTSKLSMTKKNSSYTNVNFFIYYTAYTQKCIMGDNNNEISIKNKISNGRVFRYRFHNHYINYNLYLCILHIYYYIICIIIIYLLYIYIYRINIGFQFFNSAPFANSCDVQFENLWFKLLFAGSISLHVFFLTENVSLTRIKYLQKYECTEMTSKHILFYILNQLKLCGSNQLKSNKFMEGEITHNSIDIINW